MHKVKILVVDDEVEICWIFESFLNGLGYDVISVNNGSNAIELLRHEEFDLVLCDYVMPGVSGREVFKALDDLEKRPKAILVTALSEMLMTKVREDIKADFIMKKPFDLLQLKKHVETLFKR